MTDRTPNPVTYIGRMRFRSDGRPFGIRGADRLFHLYVIGKTGTGKTTLLRTLIAQDLARGEGLAVIDPHGDLVDALAASVPEDRQDDVIYFNVPDPSQPYGYNPLRHVISDRRPLAASGLLEVFKKMWNEFWGVRMEHILRNALLALMDVPGATLADVTRLLVDRTYRREVLDQVRNPQVETFWRSEYEKYSYRLRADGIAPIQNKVGAFLANPVLHRVLTAPERPLSIRAIMDGGKVLLVNLAKGKLGEDPSSLLGGLLVTTIGLAAFSRADSPEETRRDFYLYIDEFQSFTTLALANMLSELRKYRVGLVMAHQYLHQLDPDIRHAVLGNVGTLVSFRLGPKDAAYMAKEFEPRFEPLDLLNLANYEVCMRLLIDGAPSQPFSARTLRPDDLPAFSAAS